MHLRGGSGRGCGVEVDATGAGRYVRSWTGGRLGRIGRFEVSEGKDRTIGKAVAVARTPARAKYTLVVHRTDEGAALGTSRVARKVRSDDPGRALARDDGYADIAVGLGPDEVLADMERRKIGLASEESDDGSGADVRVRGFVDLEDVHRSRPLSRSAPIALRPTSSGCPVDAVFKPTPPSMRWLHHTVGAGRDARPAHARTWRLSSERSQSRQPLRRPSLNTS